MRNNSQSFHRSVRDIRPIALLGITKYLKVQQRII